MKLYLAGCKNIEYDKKYYRLESFYSFKDDIANEDMDYFILDSGAFNFLKTTNKCNFVNYLNNYIKYIKTNNIKYFIELDLYSIIGIKQTETLRMELEQKTNKQCIPVWHKMLGKEYFINLCQNYNYIAMGWGGNIRNRNMSLPYLNWFINIAHKNGCKIHGLGFTCKKIKNCHFDSVDSTTWDRTRRGEICVFDEKKKEIKYINNGRLINLKNARKLCFHEWIKYQKYAERYL